MLSCVCECVMLTCVWVFDVHFCVTYVVDDEEEDEEVCECV